MSSSIRRILTNHLGSLQETYTQAATIARKELTQRFGAPLLGRHRMVFEDLDQVIKVPLSDSGARGNFQEVRIQGPHYARTTLDKKLSKEFELPIIRMERVYPLKKGEELPDWVREIDGAQVGWTRDGRLVAFDWETA